MTQRGDCGSCKFSSLETQLDHTELTCHRYPPVSVMLLSPQGSAIAHIFPAVMNATWCAEHVPDPAQAREPAGGFGKAILQA